MFEFLKRKRSPEEEELAILEKERSQEQSSHVDIAAGFTAAESVRISTQQAATKFAKPPQYTGYRHLFDDGVAKRGAKIDLFKQGQTVVDPYTGMPLVLTKAEAKALYSSEWTSHLAEADHILPIEQGFGMIKDNPWVTTSDGREAFNSSENLSVTSRKFNNAKRSRTNQQLIEDTDYLESKGLQLSEDGKQAALQDGKAAEQAIRRRLGKSTVKNIVETGHEAGMAGAQSAGTTTAAMSGIMNIVDVINGTKEPGEALADTAKDTGRAAASAYVTSGGLTVALHSLSDTKSEFLKALAESDVPGKIVTAVMVTGDTLKRYVNGEITTQECLIDLGERGLNFATTGYAMTVGQAIIPIPVIGAAVGAFVGSALTSSYYRNLIGQLQQKELEHQERMRIIAECRQAAEQANAFRAELETYLEEYFREYRNCFDSAISSMQFAFQTGDANGVIAGANQITRKLGGQVHYETVEEFKDFFDNTTTDFI